MKFTHITESNLLYSKFTDLNVNFIPKTLIETFRIMFDSISRHHDPAKVTHKIDYHTCILGVKYSIIIFK